MSSINAESRKRKVSSEKSNKRQKTGQSLDAEFEELKNDFKSCFERVGAYVLKRNMELYETAKKKRSDEMKRFEEQEGKMSEEDRARFESRDDFRAEDLESFETFVNFMENKSRPEVAAKFYKSSTEIANFISAPLVDVMYEERIMDFNGFFVLNARRIY